MKYAIYALCVSSHQHSQCRQCKDGPSDDLASVAEPMNDPPSSPGTALPSPLPQQALGRRRQPPGPGERTECFFLAVSLLVTCGFTY